MSDQDGFAVPSLPAKPKSTTNNQPSAPPLRYEKPSWSSEAMFDYKIEMLKGGLSVETVEGPKKEFVTIGRLPICDIQMEHQSISRYHAVIQFNQDGDAFIYDLESAHGTILNKKRINPREYMPLKPGDQLRFGESTRICIFESQKPYDPEAELEEKRRIALEQRIAKAKEEAGIEPEDEGATWGFGEDAIEDEDEEEEEQEKSGDASLLNIEAEKMAFEDAKRRREDLETMYGDDSDEEFYDRTSKKKKKEEKAQTHEELVAKQKQVMLQIQQLEKKIDEKTKEEEAKKDNEEEDLDSYMQRLDKNRNSSEKSLFSLKKELTQLKKENEKLVKLVKFTKPSDILS
ncbi:SMAD/FHA domain-containing protein [Rhizopus microsporus ATCC 52813]|uniref:SMAD/FHA domain-containing protein n=1 Tax=Rhizopus microsporus ATCC 52813 TaxID=1340429 RepID=A0A2G4SM78_RHIZD|nr:SMAD/FHA domain-containing protein [Rhizopus microsporus ATCC 52813]PHZ09869.1 SMAD/FHA domain-containing protein [Rhizopus microsporus ATCC 52813]